MKKFFALLLIVCLVLSMAACGGKTDEPTDAPEATDAPTEAPVVTDAPAQGTEPAKEEKGCGGMIAGGVIIVAILGTAVVFKKRD